MEDHIMHKECFYGGPHNAQEYKCVRNNNRRNVADWAWQEEYESFITRLEKDDASA